MITGVAGFIGSFLSIRLLKDLKDATIVGIDCLTDYNPIELKQWRLQQIYTEAKKSGSKWIWVKGDIADEGLIEYLFSVYKFDVIVNLAAQAGVRYSITNPDAYIHSNIIGFYNLLEAARYDDNLEHLVYASSSSVY